MDIIRKEIIKRIVENTIVLHPELKKLILVNFERFSAPKLEVILEIIKKSEKNLMCKIEKLKEQKYEKNMRKCKEIEKENKKIQEIEQKEAEKELLSSLK